MSHGITNRRGRRGHRVIRVWESFCVSPIPMCLTAIYLKIAVRVNRQLIVSFLEFPERTSYVWFDSVPH
jgi:hypothetical protein